VIHAAGLLDYLSDRMAARLLEVCSGLLNPGGEVVVANFIPDIADAGYMESYMGWHLAYRHREAMLRLAASLPSYREECTRCYSLGCSDIIYLSISRAPG
jgi:O-methyltransferase involved in polyketide biosynthesis